MVAQTQTNLETQIKTLIPLTHLAKEVEFYSRQGPAFTDQQSVEVLAVRGKTLYTITDEYDQGYPYRVGGRVAVVPTNETELIVLKIHVIDNTSDIYVNEVSYLVYIKGYGWWLFSDGDAKKVEPDKIEPEKLADLKELKKGYAF